MRAIAGRNASARSPHALPLRTRTLYRDVRSRSVKEAPMGELDVPAAARAAEGGDKHPGTPWEPPPDEPSPDGSPPPGDGKRRK
jgi:hypothetical protein